MIERDSADGAQPNHLCSLLSLSYSARRPAVTPRVDTSAGATSHQTPAPGRSACGMTGTTITTGPGWPRVADSASRSSAAVVARQARAPSPAATCTRSRLR